MKKKSWVGFLVLAILFSFAQTLEAATTNSLGGNGRPPQGGQGPGGSLEKGGQMEPNEEAIEACEDLSGGDSCSFTLSLPAKDDEDEEEKEMTGTCQTSLQDEDQLVCQGENGGKKNRVQNQVENQIRVITEMLARETSNFEKLENRLEKLIEFLDSEDIDTSELESDLTTLKTKADDILSAIENYSDILESLEEDEGGLNDEAKETRDEVKNLLDDFKDFYQDVLKADIQEKLDELDD